ncbi:bifunctional (p)ppGpp synthetase/guanosine-3',5'-bis(diphosphate) 3'-pyrophosphohydrolase [Bacillales bacterium AN1005]
MYRKDTEQIRMGIEQLLEKAGAYIKEPDLVRIREAYEFADQAHHGQTRKSGEPYILHPLAVADIVVNMQMDTISIIAALLHDVVEDTTVSLEEIRNHFGNTCAMLVDGLTKLERIQFRSKEEQQNENYRKMFIAMAQDIRVIVIKLADRLHNMRTLKFQSEESQRRISYETLEIFCPIANRLGISAIKWEMEDIALRYLNPQQYYRIANLMHKKRAEREQYIDTVMDGITSKLEEMGIQADLSGRPKHIYSVFKKMTTKNKQFNEIYDLLAIRIIVDNIKDCYATLGIIHTLWKPMPGRFKDYIAMPKANMYQSLHTTVVGLMVNQPRFRSELGICTVRLNLVSLPTGRTRKAWLQATILKTKLPSSAKSSNFKMRLKMHQSLWNRSKWTFSLISCLYLHRREKSLNFQQVLSHSILPTGFIRK